MSQTREPIYVALGKRIAAFRQQAGLTQAEVAERMGWAHRTSVHNLERGIQRLMLHDVPALAKALKVPIGDLFPPAWSRTS